METRRVLWAVALGLMLAVTGCGDEGNPDSNGNGTGGSGTGGMMGTGGSGTGGMMGTGGTTGGGVEAFCQTLCESCAGGAVTQCRSECETSFSDVGSDVDFDSCPNELNALGNCLSANNCNSDACTTQLQAYVVCIVGLPF